jgi:Molybdopterin-binding domain of aldehyde dehydrogenase
MYEEFAYDENGQPLSESFVDYLIPTAMDVLLRQSISPPGEAQAAVSSTMA